jgi:Fe-S-cluster containining protein
MAVSVRKPKAQNPEPGTQNPRPETSNMCLGCNVRCCSLIIDLTIYDIIRIAVIRRLPPEGFVTIVRAEDDDAFAFRALGTKVKAVLKQGRGTCMFMDSSASLKCTNEEAKPAVCLAYPFALFNGKPVLRTDVVCPAENLLRADTGKMSANTLMDYLWERNHHVGFVNDWNAAARGDETADEFFKFADKEMELEKTPWGSFYRKLRRSVLPRQRRIS